MNIIPPNVAAMHPAQLDLSIFLYVKIALFSS